MHAPCVSLGSIHPFQDSQISVTKHVLLVNLEIFLAKQLKVPLVPIHVPLENGASRAAQAPKMQHALRCAKKESMAELSGILLK